MALHFLNNETEELFNDSSKRLYRILPLDRVVEIIDGSRWSFVSPTLWNDPFEKAFLEAEYSHKGEKFSLPIKPQKTSKGVNYKLFSICFTQTMESEAFWKTYAPNGDGIRLCVKAQALKNVLQSIRDYDVYIGKAIYENFESLYKFQEDAKFWRELKSVSINNTHLNLMLKKRKPFEYEDEVRIMLLRKKHMSKGVAKILIKNTKSLIEKILIDPRMGNYMAQMVKESFVTKGFDVNVIKKSRLYSKPESTIIFKTDVDIN